jgi:hypothetical protein
MERSLRVAVIVVAVLTVTSPSQASQSCMTKAEARKHYASSHIYWHGPDHCWDATPPRHGVHGVRRREPTREVERKIDQGKPEIAKPDLTPDPVPKWRDSMSEMLPDTEQNLTAARRDAADASGAAVMRSDAGTTVASTSRTSASLASRWVDIVQVVPPTAETKLEPAVAPSGTLLPYAASFVLAAGFIVLLLGFTLRQWPRSTATVREIT